MPQSLSKIYLHIVFSTKDRAPFLEADEIRYRLHAYLAETCNQLGCNAIIVGGVKDHVHILCSLTRTITVADLIKEIKRVSSIWLKSEDCESFAWQRGYGAFSTAESLLPEVTAYVRNQEQHHRELDFKTEFRLLLHKHGIEHDERYVWD